MPNAGQWFPLSPSMTAVYLNILGIILLAEPAEPFCSLATPVFADARGVHSQPRLLEIQLEDDPSMIVEETTEESDEEEMF